MHLCLGGGWDGRKRRKKEDKKEKLEKRPWEGSWA